MSSQRGNVSRTRKQKHTNSISFKNNKHGDTPKTKVLNSLQICNVCAHCQGILEWKIKYNKYKMLTAPAKCTKCLEKTVKQAYTIMCLPCAGKLDVCAKCGKKEEIVARPGPSVAEKAQIDARFQHELKSLSERKRRTFLRYLEKMEKPKEEQDGEETKSDGKQKNNWMEKAEKRLELLKLEVEKDKGDDDDGDSWDSSDDLDDDISDDEDECSSS